MTWRFDPDNEGNSFRNGYGLLDENGNEVGVFIETGPGFDDDEQARARLAAAAPDLLEACEEIQQILAKWAAIWSGRPTKEDCAGLKTIADAAIAKAKGETK